MKQKSVLLVNEVSACESLAQALHNEGFAVIPASDQHEAFSKFETNQIDLVLLDVDLGHKLGWAAFKRLADRVPVIVIRMMQSRAVVSAISSFLPSVRAWREQAFQISLPLSETGSPRGQFRQNKGLNCH